MQNLNDYYYFVQVVKYQGYTKASNALGITKSKLSRHITDLEERLKIRLIQRNTRKFAVTDLGQQFYEHCLKILAEVQNAEDFVHSSLSNELCGKIRISCPVALVEVHVGRMIAQFMSHHPHVEVQLLSTNDRVDIIEQGIDLAIRVRNLPLENSDLIVRDLDAWEHVLVASPTFLKRIRIPVSLEELEALPAVGFSRPKQVWSFQHTQTHEKQSVTLYPSLKTDSFTAMKEAVKAGVGIASMPKVFVREELKSGELLDLLPEWQLPRGVIHVAYATRQGMPAAVRALLEHLFEQFRQLKVE